jgi:hypothetical protein
MKQLKQAIERGNAAFVAEYGITLAHCLRAYCKAFGLRADITVTTLEIGPPTDAALLREKIEDFPDDLLAFYAEMDSIQFTWVLNSRLEEAEHSAEGSHGGRLNLVRFDALAWSDRPDDHDWEDYIEDTILDDLQAEGSAFLSRYPGRARKQAQIRFDDQSADRRVIISDIAKYLTQGARAAFGWYWPTMDSHDSAIAKELSRRSLSRDTPRKQIIALLKAKGLSDMESSALAAWLGADAVVLLDLPEQASGDRPDRAEALRRLKELGIKVESDCLFNYINEDQVEVFELLLIAGADPNMRYSEWDLQPYILGWACGRQNTAAIRLLIEFGADPFLPDFNGTVMDNAGKEWHCTIIKANKSCRTVIRNAMKTFGRPPGDEDRTFPAD